MEISAAFAFDKGALDFTAMSFERPFVVGAPVNGYGPASHNGRSDQRMNAVFDRPIKGKADEGVASDMRHEFRRDALRQVFRTQAWIVQKARKPFDGGFFVFKGRRHLGLRAGAGFQQGSDKGDEGLDLVTVSPRIQLCDKFSEAGGSRVCIVHTNNSLLRLKPYHSPSYKMCLDLR